MSAIQYRLPRNGRDSHILGFQARDQLEVMHLAPWRQRSISGSSRSSPLTVRAISGTLRRTYGKV